MKLYIDPGTGSMLFSLAIGLLSVIWFGVRKLYMNIKYQTPGKTKTDIKKKDIVIYGEDNSCDGGSDRKTGQSIYGQADFE